MHTLSITKETVIIMTTKAETTALQNEKTEAKKAAKKTRVKRHPHAKEFAEATLGAAAGAIAGSVAGPPGAIAGAVIGAAAGTLIGIADEREAHREAAHDKELDDEIGVTSGSLGAPGLKHPPAKHGLYSGAAAAVGTTVESTKQPASGPMSSDGEE